MAVSLWDLNTDITGQPACDVITVFIYVCWCVYVCVYICSCVCVCLCVHDVAVIVRVTV